MWKDDSSTNVKEVTKTQRARMRRAQTSNSQGKAEGGTCHWKGSAWANLSELVQGSGDT